MDSGVKAAKNARYCDRIAACSGKAVAVGVAVVATVDGPVTAGAGEPPVVSTCDDGAQPVTARTPANAAAPTKHLLPTPITPCLGLLLHVQVHQQSLLQEPCV